MGLEVVDVFPWHLFDMTSLSPGLDSIVQGHEIYTHLFSAHPLQNQD